MASLNKGFNRLSITLGLIGVVFGVLLSILAPPNDFNGQFLFIFLIRESLFFLIPYSIVQVIGWIVKGFTGMD